MQGFEKLKPRKTKACKFIIFYFAVGLMQIDLSHLEAVHDLPYYHGDPFDRMIIAQSLVEKMPIIGCDGNFQHYPITFYW